MSQKELNDEILEKLKSDFEYLSTIKNILEREYELIKRSKEFNEKFSIPLEDYYRLFKVYLLDKQVPDWIERIVRLVERLDPVARIVQGLAFIAIIIGAVQFLQDTSKRQAQIVNEKWLTVASNVKIGSFKREAIEYLHERGEILSNLEAIDAELSQLNLPGKAKLQRAKFNGANLYRAYLKGANLYRSDFSKHGGEITNLDSANLQDSDLRGVNFTGANLQKACFRGANLETANFTKAYLVNTDFRGARNLTKLQVLEAKTSYQRALYDEDLRIALGINTLPSKELAEGCKVSPRSRNWWSRVFGK
jgi:predicted transcriptional regulator